MRLRGNEPEVGTSLTNFTASNDFCCFDFACFQLNYTCFLVYTFKVYTIKVYTKELLSRFGDPVS